MSLFIGASDVSSSAKRNLEGSGAAMQKAIARLTSGLRINQAADDAAGLAISQRLSSQVAGFDTAARNTVTMVNLVQTADGSLDQVSSLLQRNRELAVQAANDTLTASDRASLQAEVNQNTAEINLIAGTSSFGGTALLDGSFQGRTVQVGPNGGDTVQLSLGSSSATALGVGSLDLSTAASASAAITKLDTALDTVGTQRSSLGAVQNRLQSAVGQMQLSSENLTAARSRILDADFATEVSQLTRNQILLQSSTAMLTQANVTARQALQLLQ